MSHAENNDCGASFSDTLTLSLSRTRERDP